MPYALLTNNPEANQPDIYYLADAKRKARKAVKSGQADKAEVVRKDGQGNLTSKVYWIVERTSQGDIHQGSTSDSRSLALQGNQNALKGEHGSQVIRLPVELLDALYTCLSLEGEPLTKEDPDRIREYVLGILGGYVRRRIEDSEAIIL